MSGAVVRVIGQANGEPTPHDGEYVVSWDPHTPYGDCAITTTKELARARIFTCLSDALEEYRTVSRVQPQRPTDGKPNRPLMGLSVMFERLAERA